ncbi:conserved Plasmodium protein, unknown function [Plasmodium berghei]|uniref:Uncharacterized protein n=2 Tax=Plasmodium berghei TaxID=5821 RepID=A0A509AN88_PLABA|nr:conserved Plasmodium protein, unknown function [Plasmodium berghei ANKA]CXI75032.1 conserved Plasmodium protein, unknown function [Plasmodium berghei]SCM24761.1 conserved Plasmodium protein, unknown function [Plasmodium berghei]SCN27162.1 conserved Plasmodium protein, unknown function [Plasmodium berghei]SCO61701.1 conserved Plasmodium protein, unknown function [Plasmodium berghei]SCO63585.1 conserved Plasmodium protein, unknown function [Plasmodium berghei]|eukprot:XP_034422796.1 conserved Plasmodium protein, unknown function [Plasmodium berghei ANKA]
MNKENTEKLIKIINLLDKLCEYNEGETDGCKKSKSFASNEISKTFNSLEYNKSLFPISCEQNSLVSKTNKIINEIKISKTLFFSNKSHSNEKNKLSYKKSINSYKDDNNNVDTDIIDRETSEIGNNSIKKSKSYKEYIENENTSINIKYNNDLHNKPSYDSNFNSIRKKKIIDMKNNYFLRDNSNCDKIFSIYSSYDCMFPIFKCHTYNFMSKKKTLNVLKVNLSDSELIALNNSNENKKKILKMIKHKKEIINYTDKILNEDSLENSEHIVHLRKYNHSSFEIGQDSEIDQKRTHQMLENIIHKLNTNINGIINIYKNKINKLNRSNVNLSRKLEDAVEHNDDQIQEIRDLNKIITTMKGEKIEMNKIIEGYEFDMNKSKKLIKEEENNEKQKNILEREIKNLKKELNIVNSLNDKIKDEQLLLQEKIQEKNKKNNTKKHKIKTSNASVVEKNEIPLPIELKDKKVQNEKKNTIQLKIKKDIIDRYRSDTILDNYLRIKNKLLESNEKCYFLSKTNFELFKGLKKKKKKIDSLKKKVSYLKHFAMEMKKVEIPYLHLEKEEPISSIIKSRVDYLSPSKYEPNVKISRKRKSLVQLYNTNQYIEVDNNRDKNFEGLKKRLKNLNNENNLLKNKYEMVYKKYIGLLKKLRENKEFTFIEEKKIKKTKELFPKPDVIHYFYLKQKNTDIRKKYSQDNKIENCIKVEAVDKTKNNTLQYRNYKDGENYSDVEFYISNEFLKRIDVKDILNIRYIYSYGNIARRTTTFSEKGCASNYYNCVW